LEELGKKWDIDVEGLSEASRLAAKVDNALVQDGYTIYHHALIVSRGGKWAVVQQGMNPSKKLARRYHWANAENFFDDPHEGIVGIRESSVINLASSRSSECRKVILDIVKDGVFKRDLALLFGRTTLLDFFGERPIYYRPSVNLGAKLNYERIARYVPRDISDFKELVLTRGIGPSVFKALALVAELIYRAEADWRDPATVDPFKFSFAVGGKDGVPYPIDKRTYDELLYVFESLVDLAIKSGDRGILNYLRKMGEVFKTWRPSEDRKRLI